MPNKPISDERLMVQFESVIRKHLSRLSAWEKKFSVSVLSIFTNRNSLTNKQRQKVQEIIVKMSKPDIGAQMKPVSTQPQRKTQKSKNKKIVKSEINLQLINAKDDVEQLARQIEKAGRSQGSTFLFYGPPGTGKSIYGKYIADIMGLPAKPIFVSDILGAYVGESEGNIRNHFKEAQENGEILIFDEVDSLLITRSKAVRSYEISTVNEFLTQLEHHTLPVICTTNFMGNLDPAVLRRLLFKIEFDYMSKVQAAAAYHWFFGKKSPKALANVNCLTPADFDVVRRKAQVLGLLESPEDLVEMLKRESKLKPDTHEKEKSPIGFRP
jgi:SpoVK/Ycf46/Vps4 family AAA+-type ATPase